MNTIHLDMDGVLADLNTEVRKATGYVWGELPSKKMWQLIRTNNPTLFLDARPLPDSFELVEGVLEYAVKYGMQVEILTAIPVLTSMPTAEMDKRLWLSENFPELIPKKFKIGPHAKDKHKHAVLGDILIDDSHLNIRDWAKVGGVAIMHKNAQESLNQLKTSKYRQMKLNIQ